MFRERWGRVVAMLIAVTGDWDLAEECAQEAFAIALDRWRRDGVPAQPGPWLMATARNAAIDRVRRRANGAGKLREVAVLSPADTTADPDDRLALIFTCCHPALGLESRVALTLRTLGGLSTAEIARAFMVSEPAMAQRLVRAKRKIAHAAIPYRVPGADELAQRTSGVLAVLYLLFNEGYAASAGADLMRQGLCAEAIHLARVLSRLMPAEGEVQGLVALLVLQDARRAGRTTAGGDVIVLEDQDRGRWDGEAIADGLELLRAARRDGPLGAYGLQAAIAAQHAIAPTAADTDWVAIVEL
jgi:RNA polymerase sigma-70 factor, ECF subfamily